MVAFFEPAQETTLDLPTPEQARKRQQLQDRVAELEADKAPADAVAAAKKEAKAFTVDSTLVLAEFHDGSRDHDAARARLLRRCARRTSLPACRRRSAPRGPPARRRTASASRAGCCSPDHPLVARVQVNRLWGHLFGRPLVATPEDFGTQAPPVDQPELLDWLATEFVRLGWSQKALHAHDRAVRDLSPAVRRARRPNAKRDPQNRWLARGARFRLPAEPRARPATRGERLLSPAIGGPGVFPLQADTSGVIPTNKADIALETECRRRASPARRLHVLAPHGDVRAVRGVRRADARAVHRAAHSARTRRCRRSARSTTRRVGRRKGARRTHGQGSRGRREPPSRSASVSARRAKPDAEELELLVKALHAEAEDQRWTLLANALLNLDEALSR
jgi:hypothetical protein